MAIENLKFYPGKIFNIGFGYILARETETAGVNPNRQQRGLQDNNTGTIPRSRL
jgi:hypothetical protein